MIPEDEPIVVFDGICNLCCGIVKFLIRIDKKKKLRFVPIQSYNKNSKTVINNPDTIILKYKGEQYQKSDAALKIFYIIGNPWKYFQFAKFVPRIIRDFIYDLIAGNRYKIFGMRDECLIPDEEIKSRFIQ
ncbi:MAG: DUF393 domain-containing protein [Melioribacteraceae bacterium]|nr:DUF393 domain-containing protein [Melioribacteraceae bacterium]